jgi:hypothetical protein
MGKITKKQNIKVHSLAILYMSSKMFYFILLFYLSCLYTPKLILPLGKEKKPLQKTPKPP